MIHRVEFGTPRRRRPRACLAASGVLGLLAIGLGACGTTQFPSDAGSPGTGGQDGTAGPQGPPGDPGPLGPAGADGQLRIYGDENAPSVTVSADSNWGAIPPESTVFKDLTIAPGKNLYLPSGMVIRCSGTFTNHGTIEVSYSTLGGRQRLNPGVVYYMGTAPPEAGLGISAAAFGECGGSTHGRIGGPGGLGLLHPQSVAMLPGSKGGGSGAGGVDVHGGHGGGTLVILARAGIQTSAGSFIICRGGAAPNGAGGGAGGVVVLASPESITHAGSVDVSGGNGGISVDLNGIGHGAGGAGGGGLAHFVSPVLDDGSGTVIIAGGAAGVHGAPNSIGPVAIWQGGGGGGACIGGGGTGGAVNVGQTGLGSPAEALPGATGAYLKTRADPTPMF